ncbi:flippase [Asaccharospora irregularis DSM 2635]
MPNKSTIIKAIKSKVIINGMWLYLLQFFNTIVPFFTLPYVTRVLGSDRFGIFSFALNITGYIIVLVEYGFNLTAVRKVSLSKDRDELSKIYSIVTVCKVLLMLFTIGIIIVYTIVFKIQADLKYSILILYCMVIGLALQQTWLFQGMQEMKFITVINVFSRLFSVILVFAFVNNREHLNLYSFLYSFTFLLNGIMSMIIVRLKFHLKFVRFSLNDIKSEFSEGWKLFTTNAMAKIFSGFGVTILGIMGTSNSDVGIYSAILKIPTLVLLLFSPISQALFPYISKFYDVSFSTGVKRVKKVMSVIMPLIILFSLVIIIASQQLIYLLYGSEYSGFNSLLYPLIIWAVFSILNNFLGIQILVASGKQKKYSSAFYVGVAALVLFSSFGGYFFGMYGIAYAAMFAEVVLTLNLLKKLKCETKHTIENISD